ncbi:MAG: hypothetical protein AAGI24_07995 [Pseudomonadota bacterium]
MRRRNLYTILFLSAVLFVYLAFLDTLAKPVFEKLATEQYGAEVSIDRLELKPFLGEATLFELQVADRRDAMRNLVQADRVYLDLDIVKLVENVVDVSNMEIEGLLAFAPREQPATILRPLVEENSPLAQVGLPSFDVPDIDSLIERKRDAFEAEIQALETLFEDTENKWKARADSVPGENEIKAFKARIKAIKKSDNPAEALAGVAKAKAIYREINQQVQRINSLRGEFEADIRTLREQVNLATQLPQKYTGALVTELGLDSEQVAQLGRELLRGDMDGLLQQVLAPLAFNASGEAAAQEDAMPVFVRRATVSGSLLPSAAGLSVNGELKDFAWPLDNADEVASLLLNGSTLDGGALVVKASVDHRNGSDDSVAVNLSRLPLKDMALAGTEKLGITLEQTLADVSGELRVSDGKLQGAFVQRFTESLFDVTLAEDAPASAALIAEVLKNSTNFMMQLAFAGTLQEPEVRLSSDMDQLFQTTIASAIDEAVSILTASLSQRMTEEVGPGILAARDRFGALEGLRADLERNIQELSRLSK